MSISNNVHIFHPVGFLIFNFSFLLIAYLVSFLIANSHVDNSGDLYIESNAKITKSNIKRFLIGIIVCMIIVCMMVRLLSIGRVITKVEEANTIEFDGTNYTVNNEKIVRYNNVYHDEGVPLSYIVDERRNKMWIFGIDNLVTTYVLVLSDSDYERFYSQDIRSLSNADGAMKDFIYNIESNDEEGNISNKEVEARTNTNSTTLDNNELILNKLDSIDKSITEIQNNVKQQRNELDTQKEIINNYLNSNKNETNVNRAIIILIGLAVVWLLIIITVVVFIKIRTSNRKELIQAASEAKIREGVMLDKD